MAGGLPWEAAEDAFLALFVSFERYGYGTRYCFADGNRRFNAVRVASAEALASIDWAAFVAEHEPHFAGLERALTLQLPEPLTPPPEAGAWTVVGPAYEHVRTPLASFARPMLDSATLRRCEGLEDATRFVTLSLPSQIPPPMRERLAREGIGRIHGATERGQLVPFLYEVGGEPIGTVAAIPFRDGHSVFALAVTPSHRGQGHMKAIYAGLARALEGDLYGQIEDGLATMGYRARLAGTERLARTRTYRRSDDPRFAGP
ncbi:MAG: GNAT family N-acetyltransferase [Sandaracinaceae bacterium]|nr:GNAT family N-acetyltransferase [Sandaracinaceae bacterium]